jgi:predicted nucleic acid-binding protein
MKYTLDSSVFVGYFLPEDKSHKQATQLVTNILNKDIEYACISKISVTETGYILERVTNDREFVYQSLYTMLFELGLDVIEYSWDFIIKHSHFKAINHISFCDNAVITAANLTASQAVFSKEKEIIALGVDKIQGAEVLFLDDLF